MYCRSLFYALLTFESAYNPNIVTNNEHYPYYTHKLAKYLSHLKKTRKIMSFIAQVDYSYAFLSVIN